MEAFSAWVRQLEFGYLLELLLTAAAAVLCITFHELCHGLAALALGDPTAKRAGRLSFNPLKHLDLMGFAMLTFAKFGWARPVPINPRYFRNPKAGMAITALAGPAANVVLCALAAAMYTVCAFYELYLSAPALGYAAMFFYYVFFISAGLAVFNLLPVPPLDGSKVLFALLPERLYWKLMRYERYGMIALVVLLLTGLLDVPLGFLREGLIGALVPVSEWTLTLLMAIHN